MGGLARWCSCALVHRRIVADVRDWFTTLFHQYKMCPLLVSVKSDGIMGVGIVMGVGVMGVGTMGVGTMGVGTMGVGTMGVGTMGVGTMGVGIMRIEDCKISLNNKLINHYFR